MQFNSIEFIFYFLPLFAAVYLIIPEGKRSLPLLVGSLGYYALASAGNYWWVAVLVACILFVFFAGKSLAKHRSSKRLGIYLGILAAVLVFFKLVRGGRYLPAGMSFYLFQMAAYLVEVYRLKYLPVQNVISFGNQMAMFPKLLSGPLMDPQNLRIQEKYNSTSYEELRDGIHLFVLGLALKVALANRLGGLWGQTAVLGYGNVSVPFAWMALAAYAMRLYFDFYGYSLMAMGLGKMLGYDLPRNFEDPYISKTVSEFYRRWHVTLGKWFREYLYIPLGGNRKGTGRTILNLAVVWLFTGLWHGVGGNYLLWAGILFAFVVLERLWLGQWLKRSRVICHVYLVAVILLSWVPFAIGDWGQMVSFFGSLFGFGINALYVQDFFVWGEEYAVLLGAGLIFATPMPRKVWEKIRHSVWADILIVALFWVVIYYLSTAAQDPFLYFQY